MWRGPVEQDTRWAELRGDSEGWGVEGGGGRGSGGGVCVCGGGYLACVQGQ